MSTEVAKKRGRPKKVISDSIAPENSESAKKRAVRHKSTKASTSATSVTSDASPQKPSIIVSDSVKISSASASDVSQKTDVSTSTPTTDTETLSTLQSTPRTTSETPSIRRKHTPMSPVPKSSPANSEILRQVRELSSTSNSTPERSSSPSTAARGTLDELPNPILQSSNAKGSISVRQTRAASGASPRASKSAITSHTSDKARPPATPTPQTPKLANPHTSRTPKPQVSIPIAALNSTIVSQISSRAGARPGRTANELPPNYKPVARKVTMAIVALPIALVTSYVLYQRLVLGEERKLLKPDSSTPDVTSSAERKNVNDSVTNV